MAALRRVFGNRAGPTAIGVLIPPGPRTVVVLRPRSLPWDLLLIEPGDDTIRFRDFAREGAEAVADSLVRALESCRASGITAAPAPGSPGYCVRVALDRFHLIACPRLPGESYRPMVWATVEEATQAADVLGQVLDPAANEPREIYFNSRHFTH
jgi:hypothetical protein